MKLFNCIRKKKLEKRYNQLEQQLQRKQIEASHVFIAVKSDPVRNTGTDVELNRINEEANKLVKELITLKKQLHR